MSDLSTMLGLLKLLGAGGQSGSAIGGVPGGTPDQPYNPAARMGAGLFSGGVAQGGGGVGSSGPTPGKGGGQQYTSPKPLAPTDFNGAVNTTNVPMTPLQPLPKTDFNSAVAPQTQTALGTIGNMIAPNTMAAMQGKGGGK